MKRTVTICDYEGCGREVRNGEWEKNVALPGPDRFRNSVRVLRNDCVQGQREEVDLCDEHWDLVLKMVGGGMRL